MADLSNNSSVGVVIEATPGTFIPPGIGDLLQAADLKVAINGLTVTVNEYTGSIHKPGPAVVGSTVDITMSLYLRGPGGTVPPAAGAWVPGRVMRSAAFSETIVSAAIPAAPEALGAGSTTTTAVLGASAAATADLYKGMLVLLSSIGAASPKNMTMVRRYSAAKAALLGEVAGAAINGNWQLPKQLVYRLSPSSNVPTISISAWQGSRRYDCSGMAVSSFKMSFPTLSRSNQALPKIDVTYSGTLVGDYDDTAPVVTPGLAIPGFKVGKLWVAGVALGGSTLDVDFGAQVAYPPNPNKPDGNDPAQMASTTRTASLTLNQVLKATADFTAIANAQLTQAIFAQYGSASGNSFGFIIPDARFAYRSPDSSGEFLTTSGDAYIDGASADICLAIPFYP